MGEKMILESPRRGKAVRISTPQYRMLGRLIRGDVMPTHRYRKEHATISALSKKLCIHVQGEKWRATDLGKLTHARQGRRPVDEHS